MKNTILILSFISLLFSNIINAQSACTNNYNAGVDPITQGFYVGIDHTISNYSIGFDLGTSFGMVYPAEFISLTLDNNYYFGQKNKYDYKTWHINGRITYSKIMEDLSNKPNLLFLVPAIGKNFYLNKHWALNVDLGIGFQLLPSNGSSMIGAGTYYGLENHISPNFRLELKYKL